MKPIKLLLVLILSASVISLGLTGCSKKTETPAVEQSVEEKTNDEPLVREHPASEHPETEHPTDEHPTDND